MSRDDFRRLVDVGVTDGVTVEVDDASVPRPIVVRVFGKAMGGAVLRLNVDEGRQLFDALAGALALVTLRAGVGAIAGDTPRDGA